MVEMVEVYSEIQIVSIFVTLVDKTRRLRYGHCLAFNM